MFQIFRKYLVLYKKLTLPGVGSFVVEDIPARLDFTNKTIYSPLSVIRFSLEVSSFDRYFFYFLSQELHIDEISAIRKFTDISYQLQRQLNSEGIAELPGIGTLRKEFEQTYTFHPAYSLQEYFPDVVAERVVRKNSSHTVRVGEDDRSSEEMLELLADEENVRNDRWWLYAILLAASGIGALIYYYHHVR